jgi:hypothetical protein
VESVSSDINNVARHTVPFVNPCPEELNVSPRTEDEGETDNKDVLELKNW